MSLSSLISLTLALIIIAATPGPGVILTVTRSLQFGFKSGAWVVFGMVLMDVIVLAITLSGLNLLAQLSQPGLVILKWFGVAFLLWLAWQNWHHNPVQQLTNSSHSRQDFTAGLVVSLTNPVLFYLALLPTFIDLNQLNLTLALALILLISIILSSVLLSYAALASRIKPILQNQHAKLFNKVAALVLFALALLLIYNNLTS